MQDYRGARARSRTYDEVVLVPGAGAASQDLYIGWVRWGRYFSELESVLSERGIPYRVLEAREGGDQGVSERAADLKQVLIELQRRKRRALLIGHSMGGLVARIATRDGEIRSAVAVLTLSTPHRGTELADWVARQEVSGDWIELVSSWLGFPVSAKRYLQELSVQAAPRWQTPVDHDLRGVPIFSVVGGVRAREFARSNGALLVSDQILRDEVQGGDPYFEGLSDGIVPSRSQAHGVCLAWLEADHGAMIGKTLNPALRRDSRLRFGEMVDALTSRGYSPRVR